MTAGALAIRMSRVFCSAIFSLAVLTIPILPDSARAIEPEQREAIVISARAWEGFGYTETFLPSTKDQMTLIAGQESVIQFVRTLEYYWPMSRQVYVDFERMREPVLGELVIRKDGGTSSRVALQPFAVLYPEGVVKGGGRLLWAADAERAFAEYQEEERRFAREFSAAQRAHAVYERRLVESGAARRPGAPTEVVPPPAPLPEPSLKLVTAPVPGFRIALDPGDYTMALERAGVAVPNTQRRLRVIDPAGRAALVADIVPEEQWTRPVASNSGAARLFARPGAVIYLTLTKASLFSEEDYLPVVSPQAEPVAGRKMWIRRGPAEIGQLRSTWDGGQGELFARERLKVEQTRGSGFGYRVRAALTGEQPDLEAFTIRVPSERGVTRGRVDLPGETATAFTRDIVVVHPRRASLGLVLALLPIAGYFALLVWRRFGHQRIRRIRRASEG